MCGGDDAIELYRIFSRDYEHLGCFKDSEGDRILGQKMVDDENQTADVRNPAETMHSVTCRTRYITTTVRRMDSPSDT